MSKLPPWTFYPSLTEHRLGIVARIIADVRHSTVLLHEDSNGDNNWSLGCRVYARTCHRLALAAEGYDWLSVVEQAGLHFVFSIGGVPLRFYKGEPDNAPARSLRRNLPEIHAQQMALFGDVESDREDDILRLAVETDESGEAERISLAQLQLSDGKDEEEATVINAWPIDFKSVPTVVRIEKPREGVTLPPAKVLPFKGEMKKEEDERA